MAFSFRIGTKWCHDFPKLAKESGFYFNMHKSRIRVDWNRISNIDIDRIIRERDFYAIDDNVNNVIDYSLESEYDVKILDSSFVKLFRLSQLAVEYLLYCKQYLDHSVIILKDELKLKIEENVKLKQEMHTLEEIIKHLKEKTKEKNKWIESKIGDNNGEIYKCPHCQKTFISPMYVSAHIIRRHSYASDVFVSSSPVHEHYRTETEKLHNEIKSLKGRLNEAERIIRSEAQKGSEKETVDKDGRMSGKEVERFKQDTNKSEDHQGSKAYLEEINNLKTVLFDEIHNLRQKDRAMYELTSGTSVQTLMSQQEKEFQKLENQLLDKLTPDIESMQEKLHSQENYWKSKIEQLEKQHRKDVDKLTIELKLTQQVADNMKVEYESKVNNLEHQTATQSNMLQEQSKQLYSLSHEINASRLIEKYKDSKNSSLKVNNQCTPSNQSNRNEFKLNDHVIRQSEDIIIENLDNELSPSSSNRELLLVLQNKSSGIVQTSVFENKTVTSEDNKTIKEKDSKIIRPSKFENKKNEEQNKISYSSSHESDSEESTPEEKITQMKQTKYDLQNPQSIITYLNYSGRNKFKNTSNKNVPQVVSSNWKNNKQPSDVQDDISSETKSETVISDFHTQSETESITTTQNDSSMHDYKADFLVPSKSKKLNSLNKRLQINLQNTFEQKLRDLGIDPEWQGIPKATFKQKMDILKHHQKIAIKKSPKYRQIQLKLIEEMLNKLSNKGKVMENSKQRKLSIHKSLNDERALTVKATDDQNSSDDYTTTSQNQSMIPKKLLTLSEIDHTFKSISANESTTTEASKIASHKAVDALLNTKDTNSSDNFMKNDSVINSGEHKLTPNDRILDKIKFVRNDSWSVDNLKGLQDVSASPKLNKSSLKSVTGSASSLIKKKVLFHLTNENGGDISSDYDIKQEELNENNWNTSSPFDEKKQIPVTENYKNTSNILLKTSQSDKIAEISKKLEAQLNMVRQKPAGSIETIFTSKHMQATATDNNNAFLKNSFKIPSLNSKTLSNTIPQPTPRNIKHKISETLQAESISDISDLDSTIDKIL